VCRIFVIDFNIIHSTDATLGGNSGAVAESNRFDLLKVIASKIPEMQGQQSGMPSDDDLRYIG
jgi:hypothetical protein